MWIKIGTQEYLLKFTIKEELQTIVVSFRALVIFGLLPINFGVNPKKNVFLKPMEGIKRNTIWEASVKKCDEHHRFFRLEKGKENKDPKTWKKTTTKPNGQGGPGKEKENPEGDKRLRPTERSYEGARHNGPTLGQLASCWPTFQMAGHPKRMQWNWDR